jgi:hypothetical protein
VPGVHVGRHTPGILGELVGIGKTVSVAGALRSEAVALEIVTV